MILTHNIIFLFSYLYKIFYVLLKNMMLKSTEGEDKNIGFFFYPQSTISCIIMIFTVMKTLDILLTWIQNLKKHDD